MKNIRAILFAAAILLVGCKKDLETQEVYTPATGHFNYETSSSVEVNVDGPAHLAGAVFSLYTAHPDSGGHFLGNGSLNASGSFSETVILPTSAKTIYLETRTIGLPGQVTVDVFHDRADVDLRTLGLSNRAMDAASLMAIPPQKKNGNTVYSYMGAYNYHGVPSYLLPQGDVLDAAFISACNASLPENNPVPTANPHYLATGNSTDLRIVDSADVWITFVHEGAGYKNSLGYYVYPTNNPPQTANDIDTIFHIFPNVSFAGSGGGLHSGDKVYLGAFGAGYSIGWVIFQNAWRTFSGVNTSKQKFYSNPDFNPESTPAKRQHNVQLFDAQRDLVLIGFEDLHRDQGSDDDFNDAVFYVTSNPIEAIETGTLPPVTNGGTDTDNDGVPDSQDDYPNDPTRAFNNYIPFEDGYSSLAFEDLWPSQGDYDFNDLVVHVNYEVVTNGSNEIVDIEAKYYVAHIGAGYHNGFGVQMPVTPAQVTSVTGGNITDNLVTIGPNGLEAGQSKAVFIPFDDAHDNRNDTIAMSIQFASPVNRSGFLNEGFNPFIFVNGTRGREVHFSGEEPTDLMDVTLFGQAADNSDPANGIYYITADKKPWGLNISHDYRVPVEKQRIENAYLKFNAWVASDGMNFNDWYENKQGYRDATKLQ
ncbi:LruC domain-containing protein [Cryomorphaceae bacterium]|nr:LruC domain-containing protein [Cryomorphaceae bacterium]